MKNNLTYTRCGDYYIPDIRLSYTEPVVWNLFSRRAHTYLKEHRPILYNDLILSEQLFPYQKEIGKSAMHRMLAGRKGVKLVSIGPLGPGLSEEEWKKWLNYIPEFQRERVEYLSNKKAGDLTSSEIEELHRLQKELKMRSISKIYGEEEMNKSDALEYMDYSNQISEC